MKRLSTGAFAAFFAVNLGLITLGLASVASAQAPSAAGTPAADFGEPPSGEIPILFNDRHVYSKPDRLQAGRVLAAIVKNGTILVPLRSLFEQMGATVSFDPATKAVTVTKPGADVRVTVGKPEVSINGETRPLDVPPEIYRGAVVVPLRVISEGMGAYVLWVPEKRLVVVRYAATVPPTPQPSAPPAPTPAPAPRAAPVATPAPAATPAPRNPYERFIVGDYIFAPKVYNNLSPGNSGTQSFSARAAAEFPLFNVPWMLEGDFTSFRYPHSAGNTTLIGNQGQTFVPSFQARNDDFEGKLAIKVADPRVYVGIGYLFRNTNYEGGALESQMHGLGGGLEKLPDVGQRFSLYGSVFFYPNASTNGAQDLSGNTLGDVQYKILKYRVGATFDFGKSPVFIDLGFLGINEQSKLNTTGGATYSGPYGGLGIHF